MGLKLGEYLLGKETIYIYHTNDIHSDFQFWPRIRETLLKKRQEHERNEELMLAFDIGDAADRVHPLIEATAGQAVTKLFNEAQYDSVTIGNNEGTTYSKEALNHLYQDREFSVLLANLKDRETGQQPNWAKPYQIIETKTGAKIGVFALTVPFLDSYKKLGWNVLDPIEVIEELMAKHQAEADFWILLSHLGIEMDEEIAEKFPIPLIIGAHTHHVLQHGQYVAGSWLAGTGMSGEYLGAIRLAVNGQEITVEQVKLLDTEQELEPVAGEAKEEAEYLKKGRELLSEQVIGSVSKDYEAALFENSPLMDILLAAISDLTGAEVAFANAGLLMQDLPAGPVTADDLHQMLPHPIRVMKGEIKGKDIPKLIEQVQKADQLMYDKRPKGNGFRGEIFGKMCSKGVQMKEGQIYWLDEPVEADKIYTFGTVDYLSFFSPFDALNTHTDQTIYFPELLREVVGNYLTKTAY